MAVIPLMLMIPEITNQYPHVASKRAVHTDDITAVTPVKGIQYRWEQLWKLETKFGYFPEAFKWWLIVEVNAEYTAKEIFGGSDTQITTDWKCHLRASIGSDIYKDKYLASKVEEWVKELRIFSELTKTQQTAAYSAFITRPCHKLIYHMRTIKWASTQLRQVDQVIQTKFIPSITGGITFNKDERKLLSLPPKLGGLGTCRILPSRIRKLSETCGGALYENCQADTTIWSTWYITAN